MPYRARPIHEAKATLFRTLGHPARVRILELLRDGELSVSALQAELGLDSSGTSQHLAALRRVDLVEGRRDGTSVLYRVADDVGVRAPRRRPPGRGGRERPPAGPAAGARARSERRGVAPRRGRALLGGPSACALRAAWLPRAIAVQAARRRPRSPSPAPSRWSTERLSAARSRASSSRRLGLDGLSGVFLADPRTRRRAEPAARRRVARGRAARPRGRVPDGRVRRRAGARAVRPRRRHLPRRLGADDPRARRDHPRRRAATRPRGGPSSPTSPSRTWAAWASGSRCWRSRGSAPSAIPTPSRRRAPRRRPGAPSPRWSASAPRPGSCRSTPGSRARTRSRRRTSRR